MALRHKLSRKLPSNPQARPKRAMLLEGRVRLRLLTRGGIATAGLAATGSTTTGLVRERRDTTAPEAGATATLLLRAAPAGNTMAARDRRDDALRRLCIAEKTTPRSYWQKGGGSSALSIALSTALSGALSTALSTALGTALSENGIRANDFRVPGCFPNPSLRDTPQQHHGKTPEVSREGPQDKYR